MAEDRMIEEHLPAEVRKLIAMMDAEPMDLNDGPYWPNVCISYTNGGSELGWEVEWTGYNKPNHPNICDYGPTLAEACQKVIDRIEVYRAQS